MILLIYVADSDKKIAKKRTYKITAGAVSNVAQSIKLLHSRHFFSLRINCTGVYKPEWNIYSSIAIDGESADYPELPDYSRLTSNEF